MIFLLLIILITIQLVNFLEKKNVKIGCFDSCCNKTKTCNVLTKNEEQENLLITLISKIEDTELKEEYLKKLKKTMVKNADRLSQICYMRLVI
jgi:hypothetical protein